ncbi:hypothetical protein QBC37DRAFT_445189 [Rhypophila decipiens]|uniref:Uncharacterized protein n=1 Tax=Rhypophila decipiens TaxID=261697 RepID=A0AAN6XT34_9PEZI|nr:hypothetical protein QBC37DRAFT_445189 [Rhypophila decipiens]
MPVTIRTQPIPGDPWLRATTTDGNQILRTQWQDLERKLGAHGIMQNSVSHRGITPSTNGLVSTLLAAWNHHHHLILRPDDIWLAVLSQLGFFINAHAEELRSLFVAHEGKKKLEVWQYDVHPDNADYARFARQMAEEMKKHVKDTRTTRDGEEGGTVEWLLPGFSTTTEGDRAVSAVLVMGAMQKYFEYDFCCEACGIPCVTLLGEREDWVLLRDKVARIGEVLGAQKEAVEFCALLKPLAGFFVRTFDERGEATSAEVLDFWRKAVSRERPRYNMSGGPQELVTGWMTAFCFWTEEGQRSRVLPREGNSVTKVDGVEYWPLEPKDIVKGWASVPVNVKWFVDGVLVEERKCRMVAGSREGPEDWFGYVEYGEPETPKQRRVRWIIPVEWEKKMEEGAPGVEEGSDAVQPAVGWWIYEEKEGVGEDKEVVRMSLMRRDC